MTKPTTNFSVFLLATLVSLWLAGHGNPGLAIATTAFVCAFFLNAAAVPAKEALLLLCVAAVAWAWTSLMMNWGLVRIPGRDSGGGIAPLWSVAPWILLATTLNHGLRRSKRGAEMAVLTGAVIGLLVLIIGLYSGAMFLDNPVASLAAFCASWAVLLPLMNLLADTITDSTLFEPAGRDNGAAPVSMRLPILEHRPQAVEDVLQATTRFSIRRRHGDAFIPVRL